MPPALRRQSFCSGTAPFYYSCFPREHTLIAGLLSVTEPELSPFSRGELVSESEEFYFTCLLSTLKCIHFKRWSYTGTFSSTFKKSWGRKHWWKNQAAQPVFFFFLQFNLFLFSLFSYYTKTDKLENNTMSWWRDLKHSLTMLFVPLLPLASQHASLHAVGINWYLLTVKYGVAHPSSSNGC